MTTTDKIIAVFVGTLGGAGLGYGLIQHRKSKELRKINSALIEENLAIQSECERQGIDITNSIMKNE